MANPPKSLDIKYDEAAQKLIVSIDHKSLFVTKHYINRVEVSVNGKTIISKEYKNQPENNPFEYTYTVAAAKGDVINVKASCNIFGSKKAEIKVGSPDKK
jgi:desulfoferrodoxin (superoxide reductase-like protein)